VCQGRNGYWQIAVGGSSASSTYWVVRFTQDADITMPPFLETIVPFVKRIESWFYDSQEAVMQADHLRSSFNLIHFETAFKIDVFVEKDTAFDRGLLLRRKRLDLPGVGSRSLSSVSPEDVFSSYLLCFAFFTHRSHTRIRMHATVTVFKKTLRHLKQMEGTMCC